MSYNIGLPELVNLDGVQTLTNKTVDTPVIVGIATAPNVPLFEVHSEVDQIKVTGDGTTYIILFEIVDIDQASNFDVVNSFFSVPFDGNYFFSANFKIPTLNPPVNECEFRIFNIVSGQIICSKQFNYEIVRGSDKEVTFNISGHARCLEAEKILVQITAWGDSTNNVDVFTSPPYITKFSGFLIF